MGQNCDVTDQRPMYTWTGRRNQATTTAKSIISRKLEHVKLLFPMFYSSILFQFMANMYWNNRLCHDSASTSCARVFMTVAFQFPLKGWVDRCNIWQLDECRKGATDADLKLGCYCGTRARARRVPPGGQTIPENRRGQGFPGRLLVYQGKD